MERTGDFLSFLLPGSLVANESDEGWIEHQLYVSFRDAPGEAIEFNPLDVVAVHVRATLRSENIPSPAPDSEIFEQLAMIFWGYLLRLSDLAKLRHEGDWATKFEIMDQEPLSVQRGAPVGKTVTELFQAYKAAKILDEGNNRSTVKTLDEFGSTVRRFVELQGDLPIADVTRAVVQDYRTCLARFPTKSKGALGLTAQQLIAKAEKEKLPTLAGATIRNKLRALSAVLGYGVRMAWLTENPVEASGIAKAASRTAKATAARKRKDYTWDELVCIFHSPAFSTMGWQFPRRDFGHAVFWLPLLMYYTGARREELAQLAVSDVLVGEGGVACLSILATLGEDDRGRTVKTLGSRRQVPLHPDLIRLGLVDYANGLPPEGQLFPNLRPNPDGYYGVNWGKAWAQYLRGVVLLDSPASPAHGFRHTFKTLCRQAGIPEDVHDAITGHSSGAVGRGYGIMPLSRMLEELAKLPSAPIKG